MTHGLIIVNKKQNISSFNVVQIIKKSLRVKKAGHFGTLDPMAEGILLIGLGNATKFFNFYLKKKKTYSGKIRFGYATTTYDKEGEQVGEEKEIDLFQTDINTVLKEFVGELDQLPPLFSAKKIQGKPAYKYARENIPVKLKTAKISIYSLQGRIDDARTLWFRAEPSSGAYIRSLVHYIGQRVGTGAYLDELVREKIGEFSLDDAVDLKSIAECTDPDQVLKYVSPIESLLPEFLEIVVNPEGKRLVLNGVSITKKHISRGNSRIAPTVNSEENFRLFDEEGRLLAIARKGKEANSFKPYIVFPHT